MSDKSPMRQKIALIENDKIIGNNKEIFDVFKNFFSTIVAKLNIPKFEDLSVTYNLEDLEDPLESLVIKYKNHPRATLDKSPRLF